MALFRRFLSVADLGRHASELRLVSTPFQDRLLEFLERERILFPAARVQWPRSLVIEARGGQPEIPATTNERDQAKALQSALQTWRYPNADPLDPHPFDRDPAGWGDLLKTDICNHPFQNWEEFRTNIRPPDQKPLFVNDAVDTYYHGWQVFLLADALDMTMTAILDLRQEEIFKAACREDWSALGAIPKWKSVSFQGMSGLRASEKWLRHFDAVAQYKETCQRILDAADATEHRGGWRIEGQALQEIIEKKRTAGRALISGYWISGDDVISFIKWLCERWDEWHHRGRPLITGEYKRYIGGAVDLLEAVTGKGFSDAAAAVGRVTGHFTNTLDAVFPDRVMEARQDLSLTLLHSVLPKLPAVDSAIMPTAGDVDEFLDWLERKGEFGLHHIVRGIIERQFKGTSFDQAALSREVAGLAWSFEILLYVLLIDRGVYRPNEPSGDTLKHKYKKLWGGVPAVWGLIEQNWALTSTGRVNGRMENLHTQLSAIESINGGGVDVNVMSVSKILIKASLLRNDGMHNGMSDWSEDQILDAGLIFLGSLMFCRKAAALLPPPSSP